VVAVRHGPIAWFDNGKYVGSTPPGAFKETEVVTQELIRKRISSVGFHDPLFGEVKKVSKFVFG